MTGKAIFDTLSDEGNQIHELGFSRMSIRLSLYKPPSAVFSRSLVRLKCVQDIQRDLEDLETPKKSLKLSFLNQTYVVHLIAFWQAFNENLLRDAYQSLHASQPDLRIQALLKHSHDRAVARFNSPNRQNIDQLFFEGIGLKKVTSAWSEPDLSSDVATNTLTDLLSVRHEIAHTGKTERPLSYSTNFARMEILVRMSELLEGRVFHETGGPLNRSEV